MSFSFPFYVVEVPRKHNDGRHLYTLFNCTNENGVGEGIFFNKKEAAKAARELNEKWRKENQK